MIMREGGGGESKYEMSKCWKYLTAEGKGCVQLNI